MTDAAFSQADVSHCSCEDCGNPWINTADDNHNDNNGNDDDDDDNDDDGQMIGHLEVPT